MKKPFSAINLYTYVFVILSILYPLTTYGNAHQTLPPDMTLENTVVAKVMVDQIAVTFNKLETSPQDPLYQERVVNYYNFLLELLAQYSPKTIPQTATSISDINRELLDKVGYSAWKKITKFLFAKKGMYHPISQYPHIAQNIYDVLDTETKHPSNSLIEQTELLHAYNFLREALHMPLAESITAIDKSWLDSACIDFVRWWLMGGYGATPPTFAQIELVNQVKNLLKLNIKLVFARADEDEDSLGSGCINTPIKTLAALLLLEYKDCYETLFTLYHEMGHLIHHDPWTQQLIVSGKLSIDDASNRPEFKADIHEIKHYLEVGKRVVDDSTSLGSSIIKILDSNPTLWSLPENFGRREYARKQESRADLFALKKLFELRQIDAILFMINQWATEDTKSADDATFDPGYDHPSPFNRALYTIGFLASNGVDVNKEFKEWEARGICVSAEDYHNPFKPTQSYQAKTGALCPQITRFVASNSADMNREFKDWITRGICASVEDYHNPFRST